MGYGSINHLWYWRHIGLRFNLCFT